MGHSPSLLTVSEDWPCFGAPTGPVKCPRRYRHAIGSRSNGSRAQQTELFQTCPRNVCGPSFRCRTGCGLKDDLLRRFSHRLSAQKSSRRVGVFSNTHAAGPRLLEARHVWLMGRWGVLFKVHHLTLEPLEVPCCPRPLQLGASRTGGAAEVLQVLVEGEPGSWCRFLLGRTCAKSSVRCSSGTGSAQVAAAIPARDFRLAS